MANENERTGPSISGDSASAKEQLDRSKQIRREQGDYLNLLKDSEKQLSKIIDKYEELQNKVNSLSKGSININEINKQLSKQIENRNALLAKEKSMAKDIEETAKKRIQDLAKDKNLTQEQLDLEARKLNTQEQAYLNLQKGLLLSQAGVDSINKKLEIEKKIEQSMGSEGAMLSRIGQALLGNSRIQEEMVKRTRASVEETGKGLTLSQKLGLVWNGLKEGVNNTVKELGGWDKAIMAGAVVAVKKLLDITGSFSKGVANSVADFQRMSGDQVIGKLTSGVSSLASKIPFVGGAIAGIVEGFGKLLELSLAEDDKVTKIGRELGVSKAEATAINDRFLQISMSTGRTLISSKALLDSQKELSKELGVTNVLSAQILKTDVELSKLAGFDVKSRAAIAQSSIITGKSSKEITQSVLGQVGALKSATGISFNYQKILGEASALSGTLGLQFAKYPDKLTKTLVTTKSLGLELSKLDSMANSFLDFESSISKEFEAQLLTGKDINLSKAREAFLNNDLATAAKEITRQTGSASDFLKMNRIQQESIASAMGMSKDEMADMLKQQEMLSKLGAKDLKDAQAKVEQLKAQGFTRDQIAKKIGEEAYQNLTNASAQEKIAGFMERIQSAVANFLSKSPIMPLIDKAIDFLSKPENIGAIVQKIQGVFATIFDVVGGVAAGLMKIANIFGADIDKSLIKKAKSGGDFIRGLNLGGAGVSVSDNAAMNMGGTTGTQGTGAQGTATQPVINNVIHFKGQVVDTPTNSQTRNSKGVFNEATNMNQ